MEQKIDAVMEKLEEFVIRVIMDRAGGVEEFWLKRARRELREALRDALTEGGEDGETK